MKVTNNYTTHLGLGELRILPGETVDLPGGYGESHPVVKWYIARGWLTIAGNGNATGKAASAVNINTALNTGGVDDNDDGADSGAASSLANKNIDRLTLDELKTLATEMGLKVFESDTRKVIIERIKAARENED